MESKKIFILAGEESGDIRGAELIENLLAVSPDLQIDAVGGRRMKKAGGRILYDMTEFAVVGFVEVLRHYPDFRRLMSDIVGIIRKGNYDAVVLIDYPGFNLRLAKKIRPMGTRIIYYISPQVWAWGQKRIKEIARLVDRMIVLFDFEENVYRPCGLDTVFVGHPMVDMVAAYRPNDLRKQFSIAENVSVVGFLPGSRMKEVEKILPSMLDAYDIYRDSTGPYKMRFLVSAAREDLKDKIEELVRQRNAAGEIIVYPGNVSDILFSSDIVVVASGTATLQTCLYEKPMVVVYRVAFLTWAIAKMLVKIPYIGMVNVVLGEKKIPELVQKDLTGGRILQEVVRYIQDPGWREDIVGALQKIKARLGQGGAAKKAAGAVSEFLNKNRKKTVEGS
ncbi:MAG: lipid-A-disaccharide synthase [Candidatus Aureabacteria bacterium]|nr:lipid-A-disaccharide synthase [Candidatus Auribacterota bacterium]